MQLSVLALSLAAAVPIVSAYPVKPDTLHCRSGPGTSYGIVKTYTKGTDLKISCQAPGTDIDGDKLWDKTQDNCYVSDYYVLTGSSNYVTAECGSSGGGGGGSGNLPGLNSVQSSHARAIIAEAKKEGLGLHGCEAGIATALVESSILVYANSNVAASLKYPHDAVGSDHDSVGIFQQRAIYYPNIAADMDPTQSAAQFFAKMKRIGGWQSMAVGALCQEVQGSAYPDRYAARVGDATRICQAGGI